MTVLASQDQTQTDPTQVDPTQVDPTQTKGYGPQITVPKTELEKYSRKPPPKPFDFVDFTEIHKGNEGHIFGCF